ncbi:NfeD family protein [Clostridium bornimense]|uniref:NfeD family protein n=1 Tax=Clostridium bornimense TaxID=1216932 RepID=UPI001C0FDDFB|nr:NfeD family protein [Clostridium bornimense]MBU5316494.1 NfeD family protein [Clostridium bornimense]
MIYFLWVVIIIAAVTIDICSSNLLFVWFGLGALVAILLNVLGISFVVQLISFVLIGIIATLIFYPIFKKKLKEIPKTLTREEEIIGKEFIANTDIEDTGSVMIEGIYWTVINEGKAIKTGEKFIITGIVGTKFTIKSK